MIAKTGWSRVLLGIMVTAVVACSRPPTEENREFTATERATSIYEDAPTATFHTPPTTQSPTHPPPPLPTVLPTSSVYATWQQSGNQTTGLQLLAPPEWRNLSNQLNAPATAAQSGLIVLLLSSSQRVGESLLSDKPLDSGAFVAGLIAHHSLPLNTPQAALTQYLDQLQQDITLVSEPVPITAFTPSGNRITGATVDVTGEPLIFNSGQTDLRTRILLFTSTLAGAIDQDTQAIFLFSAPEASWAEFEPVLAQMARSIVIHNIAGDFTIRGGAANVVGELRPDQLVSGELAEGVKDVWTFSISGEKYASFTLSPAAAALDLTMTIFGPAGQTIAQVDNGYAGEIETAVDQLLLQTGLYMVEVGEFFNAPGGYTLRLSLNDQPLYGGGGTLHMGQTIQGELWPGTEHVWQFSGEAGTAVSVVLDPTNFDVMLGMYAPDGRVLVELDEGFSGDAEIVSSLPLPTTGDYSIVIRSFAGSGGNYTLSLDSSQNQILNYYDAGDLLYDQPRQEQLQANEAHAWFFNGHAGDDIVVEVTPLESHLDLEVWLLDSNVERLTAVDGALSGQPEYLSYPLLQDGQYLLLVRDFFGEPGGYEIRLTAVADDANAPLHVGSISYGNMVQGALAPGQKVIWDFAGKQGDRLSFSVQPGSAQADLRLVLIDPSGQRLLEIDQAGAGQTEQFTGFTLTSDGQWGLLVEEFFGEPAGYSLLISQQ